MWHNVRLLPLPFLTLRIQARHADFSLSSRLERRDVGKNGKWMHLALCRVQCGRVYDLGKPHHTRKLNDRLCDGFDSVYDDEKCCYRLSQANIQLALPLFTMEVFVKIRTSMAEVPLYWSPDVATPFGLVQVTQAERSALKEALRPGGSLGGRDRREDGDYRGFRLKEAWRLEHPGLWGKYAAEKQNMASQLLQISRDLPSPKLRAEMVRATAQLPAELDESLNEVQLVIIGRNGGEPPFYPCCILLLGHPYLQTLSHLADLKMVTVI